MNLDLGWDAIMEVYGIPWNHVRNCECTEFAFMLVLFYITHFKIEVY